MSENIIVYSCHVGKRDTPVEDGRFYVKGSDKFNSDRMNAKAPKILPHLYLPKHDYSIWVDANLELKVTKEELIEELGDYHCMVLKHRDRIHINDEITECKGLDSIENLEYHRNKSGVLGLCGLIIRKNSELCNQYNERWWAEICRGRSRDQLSFPYTLGKISKLVRVPAGLSPHTQYTKRNPHKNEINYDLLEKLYTKK